MHRIGSAVVALALLFGLAGTTVAASGSSREHAKLYYLSVGDSLAAGVQPIGDPADLYRTEDGYAEQLLATAQATYPKLSLVKLGCPGETTTTMIAGGICAYSHGSQLDEAVAFLAAHRDFVAFITIDIGANDFACYDPECLPAGVAAISTNLPRIIAALRTAAPGVPVVGMTLYNPFLAAWLLGPEGQAYAMYSATDLIGPVNALFSGLYAASGAGVADVETAFSSNDFTTMVALPGVGDVPINVAKICLWTWVCAPAPYGPDNHANASGYGAIAGAFSLALGL